jgi:hypothetical protein
MAKLDRILVSVEWERNLPRAKVTILPKGVSNHNPVMIKFGEKEHTTDHLFRFEKWWLEVDGFSKMVKKVWDTKCPDVTLIDVWQFKIRNLRKKIKGWHRNVEDKMVRRKNVVIEGIDKLDRLAEI